MTDRVEKAAGPGNGAPAAEARRALPERIFLIGFMGSGKTTVGLALSRITGYKYIDMDSVIEEDEGMTIRDIFIKRGEHDFRNRESRLLDKLCEKSGIVVSCGGGIIHDALNIEKLQECGPAVFLNGDVSLLFDRVKNDSNRPFAYLDIADEQIRFNKFADLLEKRKNLYKDAAAMTVDITGKTPEALAAEIFNYFK